MTTKNPTGSDESHRIERERAAKVLTGELGADEANGSLGSSKRILLALGGLNLAFAAGRGLLGVTGDIAGHEAAIDVFLVGGLGLLLVHYVSRLPQTEIHPEMYSRVVG